MFRCHRWFNWAPDNDLFVLLLTSYQPSFFCGSYCLWSQRDMLCFPVICHFSISDRFWRNAGSLACDQINHTACPLPLILAREENKVYTRRPLRQWTGKSGALTLRKRQEDDECGGGRLVTERWGGTLGSGAYMTSFLQTSCWVIGLGYLRLIPQGDAQP